MFHKHQHLSYCLICECFNPTVSHHARLHYYVCSEKCLTLWESIPTEYQDQIASQWEREGFYG